MSGSSLSAPCPSCYPSCKSELVSSFIKSQRIFKRLVLGIWKSPRALRETSILGVLTCNLCSLIVQINKLLPELKLSQMPGLGFPQYHSNFHIWLRNEATASMMKVHYSGISWGNDLEKAEKIDGDAQCSKKRHVIHWFIRSDVSFLSTCLYQALHQMLEKQIGHTPCPQGTHNIVGSSETQVNYCKTCFTLKRTLYKILCKCRKWP